MADNKKKKLYPKETVTPRRPVILKSDREAPKDQVKEKPEKEKQPTIILKTREQSAPKDDRPSSPKGQSMESDIGQPCKIAQNENKEKKIIEKPSPPLKIMTEPIKLLDENLEFNPAALEFMNDASLNYLVVGVVGTQGVGKSMIMNLIAQSKPCEDICQRILNSHELPRESEYEENNVNAIQDQIENMNFVENPESKKHSIDDTFKFKMQDIKHIETGVHCTKGIDMYVTEDRVILLDCQALWSPSLIDEAANTNPITTRSANVVTVDCLQLASYLMSICHVLIAVQDWFFDYNFVRYLQTAEMLSVWSRGGEGGDEGGRGDTRPHLLLLHNRCAAPPPRASDAYRKAFQRSNLQLHSGMYLYSDINKNGIGVDGASKDCNLETCGSPLNMFLLPEISDDYQNKDIYRGHPSFETLAKRLRATVLGVHRHAITNVPNLSEKGWFHFCNKAWESIRKCTFFMEYERFLP
ncbi:unnamed protein product [Plutella xylostella]|uniref:(diamondback moth) hypothetical protein n=1 Tax=Plutella xylostella TaxID=51655 RepID=A0A8S4G6W3_PLUXY|nr:unnamed protein product [Plutella xylostella]